MSTSATPKARERRRAPYTLGAVEVRPASAALGAEIRSVDLAAGIDAQTLATLRAAWAEHSVLVWRGQSLSVEQHLSVGRAFGELEDMSHVATANGLPSEILVVENDPGLNAAAEVPDSYAHGFRNDSVIWHSDNSYRANPPDGSLLYVRAAPPTGGATKFCDMTAALTALPPGLRAKIDGREAIHDPSLNSAGVPRKGGSPPKDVSQGHGPRHPLVRRHPVSGHDALYLGRRPYCYICGYSVAESENLLDRLWSHATDERFVWQRDANKAGDLFLWDNRSVMHARDGFDANQPRLAHRLQFIGGSAT